MDGLFVQHTVIHIIPVQKKRARRSSKGTEFGDADISTLTRHYVTILQNAGTDVEVVSS